MLYAAVIGIDKYKDKRIATLRHACNDAETLADRIEKTIHPAELRVFRLLNSKATVQAIRQLLGDDIPRLAKSRGDCVLLYFAGHGSPETPGSADEMSRYLVAYDTRYDQIFASGIDVERELIRWFQRIVGPEPVIFFVDACFSGRAGGRTFEGPQLKRARASGLRAAPALLSLANLDLGEGRAVITACDDNEVARESNEFGHGLFTYALLHTLTQPPSAEATIAVTTLYQQVAERVASLTKNDQHPILHGRLRGTRLPLLATRE
jgi:uncharacterized caspase-like protein